LDAVANTTLPPKLHPAACMSVRLPDFFAINDPWRAKSLFVARSRIAPVCDEPNDAHRVALCTHFVDPQFGLGRTVYCAR
jgi:hypothetical protein